MILAPFKKLLLDLRNHRLDIVASHGNKNVASHYEVMAKMLERAISVAEAIDSPAMVKIPIIPLDQIIEYSTRQNVGTAGAYHTDDIAVDRCAIAMKDKLATSRAKGRSGWDDPAQCSIESLSTLLRAHADKGDPVDVANIAMMIQQRGGRILINTKAAPTSLLRPAVSATNPLPPGCHCTPGKCSAPVIMGLRQPCRDPAKGATIAATPVHMLDLWEDGTPQITPLSGIGNVYEQCDETWKKDRALAAKNGAPREGST